MWQDLLSAFALMLVLEGILPFLSPGTTRRTLEMASKMDDKGLRVTGLASMLAGVVLLYVVR